MPALCVEPSHAVSNPGSNGFPWRRMRPALMVLAAALTLGLGACSTTPLATSGMASGSMPAQPLSAAEAAEIEHYRPRPPQLEQVTLGMSAQEARWRLRQALLIGKAREHETDQRIWGANSSEIMAVWLDDHHRARKILFAVSSIHPPGHSGWMRDVHILMTAAERDNGTTFSGNARAGWVWCYDKQAEPARSGHCAMVARLLQPSDNAMAQTMAPPPLWWAHHVIHLYWMASVLKME